MALGGKRNVHPRKRLLMLLPGGSRTDRPANAQVQEKPYVSCVQAPTYAMQRACTSPRRVDVTSIEPRCEFAFIAGRRPAADSVDFDATLLMDGYLGFSPRQRQHLDTLTKFPARAVSIERCTLAQPTSHGIYALLSACVAPLERRLTYGK